MSACSRRIGPAALVAAFLLVAAPGAVASSAPGHAAPVARAHIARVTPLAVVGHWMRRTREVGSSGTHFKKISPRVTVPDGHGGTITAVVGVRSPTADGKGQLVFFFEGRKFLGWDTSHESIAIAAVHRGSGSRIRVRYVHYGSRDPLCCPSRAPVTITYHWTGRSLIPNGTPPNATGPRVRLAASRPSWNHCADVGPAQSDTGIYYIRMLRISCSSGRRILRAWYHDSSAPDAGPRHWSCHVSRAGYSERHKCSRGSRRMQFTLLLA